MNIGIYGGSIRPGGGLTVLKQLIRAVANIQGSIVYVYTGEKDCSEGLSELFATLDNVEEIKFFPRVKAELRYALSKIYFLNETRKHKLDVLISINYFIPAICETVVYHLNLLSFIRGENDRVGMKVKRFDARMACRYADKNIFESNYLLQQAAKVTRINNSKVVYVGVDRAFHCEGYVGSATNKFKLESNEVIISVVSSPSPHKDNLTCLKALQVLVAKRPEVNWRMIFVGGLSKENWGNFSVEATRLGVDRNVSFFGPVKKEHLSQLLNESLCLMSSSLIESFCMVAIEAMKSCCPVIVTDATSMPESVGDAGVVVKQRDYKAFARGALEFYENSMVRSEYINKGIEWSRKYSTEKFNEKMMAVIRSEPTPK